MGANSTCPAPVPARRCSLGSYGSQSAPIQYSKSSKLISSLSLFTSSLHWRDWIPEKSNETISSRSGPSLTIRMNFRAVSLGTVAMSSTSLSVSLNWKSCQVPPSSNEYETTLVSPAFTRTRIEPWSPNSHIRRRVRVSARVVSLCERVQMQRTCFQRLAVATVLVALRINRRRNKQRPFGAIVVRDHALDFLGLTFLFHGLGVAHSVDDRNSFETLNTLKVDKRKLVTVHVSQQLHVLCSVVVGLEQRAKLSLR
ncbi:hypothetical protein OGAPHI_000010 [Ogataea philodendri]|uniref:Uncharacterized protein n=1 Tax=Ogataea philodendri TaxID=1378263 RepID=A0A9P8TAP6_9ASCO|nr:uncharacterized protein OGAPHI_000010 [Ogataea philodendri]KAH3671824.1 hypothetical protein OGAPHI_000010 [Ogataea philodendri]